MYFLKIRGTNIAKDKAVYQIPEYQREYVWGTKDDANRRQGDPEVIEFWDDIFERCWEESQDHFLGMILCSQSERGGESCFNIVDGQQRITSIFLFCLAVRDFLRDHGQEFHEWTEFLSSKPENPGDLREPRLILSQGRSNDREILMSLFRGGQVMVLSAKEEETKMVAAYRAFKSQLFLKFSKDPVSAQEFADQVLEKIVLAFVILGPDDDPTRIFITLNDRGRRVDEMVKLRNLIQFSIPEDPEMTDLAIGTWLEIEDKLDTKEQELFAKAFGERNGFRSIRRRAQDEVQFSIQEALRSNTFPDWLANLNNCASIFSILLNFSDAQGTAYGLVRLETEPLHPLILGIIERDGFDSEMLPALESVALRLIIHLEKPSSRLMRLNFNSCYKLGFEAETWKESLLELWRDEFEIEDNLFVEGLQSKNLFGPGVARRRATYILEQMENLLRKKESKDFEPIRFGEAFSLEQIMPKVLNSTWEANLRASDLELKPGRIRSIHESLVGTLGNLTVIAGKDYGADKEDSYHEKIERFRALEGENRLRLNQYFDDHKTWTLREIDHRGQVLAELAKELWPNP